MGSCVNLGYKMQGAQQITWEKMTAFGFSSSELESQILLRKVLVERFVSLWSKKKDERLKPRIPILSFNTV